jgi:predicted GTPase
MDSYETVRKEKFYTGNEVLEIVNGTCYWNQVNCLIIGRVSSGKSTFLNGLFGNAMAETHIRRTTMFPTRFYVHSHD